jgi:hypothetical protein
MDPAAIVTFVCRHGARGTPPFMESQWHPERALKARDNKAVSKRRADAIGGLAKLVRADTAGRSHRQHMPTL